MLSFKVILFVFHLIHFPFRAQGNHSNGISIFPTKRDKNFQKLNLNDKMDSGKFQVNISANFLYNFENASSNISDENIYSEDDQIKSGYTTQINFSLVITFCAIALFIVLVNLRVFQIVTTETQQKNKSINILVAHLSFLAICFTCVVFIYVMEKSNVFSLTAPGLCEFLSFLRNLVLSLFPLNSAATTYVRVRCSTSNISNTFLALCLIWTIAVVGSLPSIFMVTYSKDVHTNLEKCKQIPLLGTFEATLVYEVFRFLVYHLLVCSYMAHAMITIRSRIRYLYINKPIPDRMKRRVQRVRFVYLHSIIFILIWLPAGLGLGLYKLRTRIDWMADYINMYITTIVALCSSLFILSPLVYVILHEETSAIICKGVGNSVKCCTKNEIAAKEESDGQSKSSHIEKSKIRTKSGNEQARKRRKRKIPYETTGDMSRISTVVLSGTSDRSIILYTHIILRSSKPLSSLDEKSKTAVVQTCVNVREHKVCLHRKLCEHYVRETMV